MTNFRFRTLVDTFERGDITRRQFIERASALGIGAAVRQAMNKAVQRDVISTQFYGEGQPATPNILTGLDVFESPNTSWEYDLDEAAQILEDAGWVMDGDARAKDDVALEMTYATSVNQVRQKTQAVVKDSLEQLGFQVRLEQIDAGIFFGGEAGNRQNINHFYWDIDMYTSSPSSTVPVSFMLNWYAGAGDPADKYAISTRLNNENVALGPFELNYWNIANWNRP